MQDYWQPFEYDVTYHMYNKSISGRKFFKHVDDYERFLTKYSVYFGPYTTPIAYCLIPNHFHLMFRVLSENDFDRDLLFKENSRAAKSLINDPLQINDFLTDQTRRWFSGTALYMKHKYGIHGQLFLEKSKRISINSESKFQDLLCYIHHGLSKTIEEWPYSSYNQYLQSSAKVASIEIFKALGSGDLVKCKKYFVIMHKEYKVSFAWEGYRKKRWFGSVSSLLTRGEDAELQDSSIGQVSGPFDYFDVI